MKQTLATAVLERGRQDEAAKLTLTPFSLFLYMRTGRGTQGEMSDPFLFNGCA